MLVSLSPGDTLGFHRPFNQAVRRTLTISNNNAEPVLFKVKTTAPKLFCVRPNSGCVEPGESAEVQIMLQPMNEDPPLGARCKDKFLIQSTIITPEMEPLRLHPYEIWNFVDDNVHFQKMRVVYLPPERVNFTDQPAPCYPGQFDTTRIANGRDTPQIPDFDGTRGHASFEKAREDVDQTSVVNITAHHSPPLQLTPQRSREQELDNRLATMREEVNRLRALLAAMPEPTAKEEEPQSEPNGVGRCHRTTSAVAGTEAEVGIYVDEPHHPETIPSQIIIGTQTNDNRRIDLDPRVWSSSATNPPRVNSPSPSDSSAELARELRDRINSFVQTGAGNSAAHTLTEDCKIFFQENSSADHQDLHVTYQLLNRFLLGHHQAPDNSAHEEQERLTKEMYKEERCRIRNALREVRDRSGVLV